MNSTVKLQRRLTISNLYGMVTGLAADLGQGIGAKVTRRLVYAQFLDAKNFPNGNRQADPTQEAVSFFIIEQLKSLDDEIAVFELASPAETDNARIGDKASNDDLNSLRNDVNTKASSDDLNTVRQTAEGKCDEARVTELINQAKETIKNEIIGGDADAALDTIKEIGDKLKELGENGSVSEAITQKLAELKSQIDEVAQTDLLDAYNTAKA